MIPIEPTHPDTLATNCINQRSSSPESARDAGIASAEQAADPRLILAVDAVIDRWIASGRRFSANEIRDEVPTLASGLVGARVMSAFMRGDIKKVGEVRSTLRSTHAKPIGVWQDAYLVATQSARAAS